MSRRALAVPAVLLSLASLAACASTGTGGGSSLTGRHITADAIQQTSYTNAAEVLEGNRMVRARGDGFILGSRGRHSLPSQPVEGNAMGATPEPDPGAEFAIVEIDGTRIGRDARSALVNISANDIAEIRLLSPSEALTHYSDAANGLIIVKTKR